jgi:uncharacterized protein
MIKLLKSILFCFLVVTTVAQRNTKPPTGTVNKPNRKQEKDRKPTRIQTKMNATFLAKNNVIKVRWAPSNEEGWRLCNLFGYVVERYTFMRDNQLLDKVESFRLFGMVPDSLKQWEKIIDGNDNAAVMAQAMYGDEFLLDINSRGKVSNPGVSMLSKAEENKQRFLFAMYAADLDYDVAERAALAFTDTKAKPNEKYFYRIYPAAPKEYVKSDTAMLVASLLDTSILPKATEIFAESSSKSVILSWDMERTKSYYNAFFVERRAEEDAEFTPLNKLPYTTFMQPPTEKYGNSVVYIDTGLVDNKKYFYRVCGKTIFNERGAWSDVVETKSLPLLEGVPGIQGIRLDEKGKAIVSWFFEDSIRPKVKSFEINYSATGSGEFFPIKKNIEATASETYLPDTLGNGYLIVKAVSKEGISRTSFPYLYQPEDSTAPAPPTGLKAVADSNGVVTVSWLPNSEKDLLGYKIFRSIVKDQEKAILTDTVWYGNTYTDTLDLKLKNRKAYYTVAALDLRHNQSKESKEIVVTKPDIIPPTAPVFEDFILAEGSVEIRWINSTDEDIKETQLRRKEANQLEWKTVFTTKNNKDSKFIDKDIQPLKKYSYRLYAVDSSNLVSGTAQELNIQALPMVNRKAIIKVEAQVDREKRLLYLNWQLVKDIKIKSIEVFRGENKEPISLYKILNPGIVDLIENELTVNTVYKYGIRVQLATGEYSDLVIKEVNY